MAKLKLTANPTFTAKVPVPVAGGDAVDVEMTFRHRTRKQWDEWIAEAKARSATVGDDTTQDSGAEADAFMDIVVGWELEDAFNKENVATFLQNYYGAGAAAIKTYASELWLSKVKNSAPSL